MYKKLFIIYVIIARVTLINKISINIGGFVFNMLYIVVVQSKPRNSIFVKNAIVANSVC